jgi:hypothetical protein
MLFSLFLLFLSLIFGDVLTTFGDWYESHPEEINEVHKINELHEKSDDCKHILKHIMKHIVIKENLTHH